MEQFTIYLKEPQKRQLLIEFLKKMDFLEWESLEKPVSKEDVNTESNEEKTTSTPAKDFVTKWKGFLKESDIKDAKWEYLSKKYL
ncbi:MAG: hypothetical protein COZ18_06245 [Flexibacter sp. CG_4_10_14_3_um_filter_32_15]|nr:MAG: hypothetical protein COZ18_06245 [Flexibacter sp. CG_4_10_14_3_um_filter_32_15]